ncbi:MAG: hypothetical protein F6J92_25790 [Symploca sp. SIO1A3]|nr:hypothetical protein [Symploca sp. SIO1A3]
MNPLVEASHHLHNFYYPFPDEKNVGRGGREGSVGKEVSDEDGKLAKWVLEVVVSNGFSC